MSPFLFILWPILSSEVSLGRCCVVTVREVLGSEEGRERGLLERRRSGWESGSFSVIIFFVDFFVF